MDKIYPEDKCNGKGCEVYFCNYEGKITECKNCKAAFCEDCFDNIKKNNDGKCTECNI